VIRRAGVTGPGRKRRREKWGGDVGGDEAGTKRIGYKRRMFASPTKKTKECEKCKKRGQKPHGFWWGNTRGVWKKTEKRGGLERKRVTTNGRTYEGKMVKNHHKTTRGKEISPETRSNRVRLHDETMPGKK